MSEEKKLYRSGSGQILGGVCAGFAEYFNLDVTLVRILWLVSVLFHGLGAFVYLVGLILIPKNPEHENLPAEERKKPGNAGLYIGIALIFIGVSIVLERWYGLIYFWHFDWLRALHFRWDIIWPVLLILFGVWYIVYTVNKKEKVEPEKEEEQQNKKLFRSREDKMIAGVCSGLAKFWSLDPTLVRVGYVVLTVLTDFWLGIIAYFVLVIAVDETPFFQKEDTQAQVVNPSTEGENKNE